MKAELLSATKATRPRKYNIYDVFCAILYFVKEGCSWHAIPHDFPN
ncbi:MAG: transposase [Oscillospiraceae bacterium]|nr:transposase [Oscillospiraceae bacterium]